MGALAGIATWDLNGCSVSEIDDIEDSWSTLHEFPFLVVGVIESIDDEAVIIVGVTTCIETHVLTL